jgi:hypothetical protein
MTIETNVAAGFSAVALSVRNLRTLITGTATGNLTGLHTTAKANIVAAINELYDSLAQFRADFINDLDDDSLTSTYSASKIEDRLIELKENIVGGATAAYDTLQELQALLEGDAADIASLMTAVGNRVRFDAAQSLTTEQKATARTNIGAASQADLDTANANIASNTNRIGVAEGRLDAHDILFNNAGNYDYATAYNTALNAA